jgi:hypothetical protein
MAGNVSSVGVACRRYAAWSVCELLRRTYGTPHLSSRTNQPFRNAPGIAPWLATLACPYGTMRDDEWRWHSFFSPSGPRSQRVLFSLAARSIFARSAFYIRSQRGLYSTAVPVNPIPCADQTQNIIEICRNINGIFKNINGICKNINDILSLVRTASENCVRCR